MATPREVSLILVEIAAAFPRFTLTPPTVSIYADLLGHVDAVTLQTAAKQCLAESEWFPTIAAILNKVAAITKTVDSVPEFDKAWENVRHCIRKYGHDEAMRLDLHVFDHPLIETAARRFGWYDLCYGDLDQESTRRAQFRDIYNGLLARRAEEAKLLPQTLQAIEARRQVTKLSNALSIDAPHKGNGNGIRQ